MAAPHLVDFVPPRGAWLFGHAGTSTSRRAQGAMLLMAAGALVAVLVQYLPGADGEARPTAPPVVAVAMAAPAPAISTADRASINRVVRRLNTPWSTIFEALDNQAHAKVALLSLETDADRGAVRVTTEGPSLDELLQHAERVQATPPFQNTRLLRIEPPEAVSAPENLTRLSFDLVIR